MGMSESKQAKTVAQLGRVTFYLAEQYPFIKGDIYRNTPERRACEIILACKDLLDLCGPEPSDNPRRNRR